MAGVKRVIFKCTESDVHFDEIFEDDIDAGWARVFTQTRMCLLFNSKSAKIRDLSQLDKLRGHQISPFIIFTVTVFLSFSHVHTD